MSLYEYAYYYTLRNEARKKVADSINNKVKKSGGLHDWNRITLSSIDRDAIDHARIEWPKHYLRETHNGLRHSWDKLLFRFVPRPSYFDLAVWQQKGDERVLQGLALGKPSNGKHHLVVNWVERSYAPTYLKAGILFPVLACAEEYARLLGCKRVLIKDPVDPEVYKRYGYEPIQLKKASGTYLCKELAHEYDHQS